MTGVPDTGFIPLNTLMTDSIGNVYVGTYGFIMCKCLDGETQFNPLTGWTPEVNVPHDYCLSACDNKGNLYEYSNIVNKNGKYEIYKCLADQTQFVEMTGVPNTINPLKLIENQENIYVTTSNEIYVSNNQNKL